MKRNLLELLIRAGMLAIVALIACAPSVQAQTGAPHYEADLSWPKPLPDRWVLGGLGGVCVDAQDHVFILNRQDVVEGDLNGGKLAPSIIEFDPARQAYLVEPSVDMLAAPDDVGGTASA